MEEEKKIPETEVVAQEISEGESVAEEQVSKEEENKEVMAEESAAELTEAGRDEVASDEKVEEVGEEKVVEQNEETSATKIDKKVKESVEKNDGLKTEENAALKLRKRTQEKKSVNAKKQAEPESEYIEKVLSIRRITKVTKGGKKLSFSALVVVGDGKSNVGYAQEKAGEVAIAIRKAMATAKKNMVKISLKGTTIPHEIIGAWGGARVLLKPASEGTGVIASGPVRAICDGAGIHNILTKCHRSNNPVNVVKATMNGLTNLKTVKTGNIGSHNAGS